MPEASAWTVPISAAGARRAAARRMLAVAAAAVAVLLAIASAALTPGSPPADAELAMLLRFMAAVKAALALAALAAAIWRLGHPASRPLAAAYALAPAPMAAGAVVIWQLAYVAGGAALFHGGLIVLLLALYADRGDASALVRTRLARRQPQVTPAVSSTPAGQR